MISFTVTNHLVYYDQMTIEEFEIVQKIASYKVADPDRIKTTEISKCRKRNDTEGINYWYQWDGTISFIKHNVLPIGLAYT